MTRTNLKLVLPSIILTLIFAFTISFVISQAINNYLVQNFYDSLRNRVYENLEYNVSGSANLEQILLSDSINIYCDALIGTKTPQSLIINCPQDQLIIQIPATTVFTAATPYKLKSISVWDSQNNLVQAIPETEIARLYSTKAKQQLSLNWTFSSNVLNIPNTDVYRGEFQFYLNQPKNTDILFTLPILNGDKSETLGYIAVYIQKPQTGIWEVASYLLPIALVLALIVSFLGAFFFSQSLRQQITQLQQVTSAWAMGDFAAKARFQKGSEIGQLAKDLNIMAKQLVELIEAKAKVASLETKQQLSRDLHDAAKQQLFAATMQLDAAKTLFSEQPKKAQKHLDHASDLTRMAQQELSAVIDQLGPVQMHEASFNEAVLDLINNYSSQQGIPIKLTLSSNFNASTEIKIELFRILQEALSNIIKHSQASLVTVTFSTHESQFEIQIVDNGIGFNTQQTPTGFGLQSMGQRTKKLNGLMTIRSQPSEGTNITIKVDKNQMVPWKK